MPSHKTDPRIVQARKRRLQAVNMRINGATYQQIADHLYNGDTGNAHRDIAKAIQRDYTHRADELFAMEDARLEKAELAAYEMMLQAHGLIMEAARVRDMGGADPEGASFAELVEGDAKRFGLMADKVARFAERRAKMHGLDKPVQVDVAGSFDTVVLDPAVVGSATVAAADAGAVEGVEEDPEGLILEELPVDG